MSDHRETPLDQWRWHNVGDHPTQEQFNLLFARMFHRILIAVESIDDRLKRLEERS